MDQNLKELFEAIAVIANTSTVFVNFKDLKLRFPVKSIKKALDDSASIEDILTHLFDRKQVTWERYNYENANWSQNSLRDLRNNWLFRSNGASDFGLMVPLVVPL
ncbi:MAG: hypothetical protein ACMVP2_03730 [Imperialibacter sp.]|uniref:hypothetical protein n=1 Tax=Imperialibacter sp. TaxID=2038411 RepID=UPI003A884FAC